MEDDESNEDCLGSIGFMFDAQHARCTKSISFGGMNLKLRMIGEDPGR
jgi:hypothetical protein